MSRQYVDLAQTDNLKRFERLLTKAVELYEQGFFRDDDYNRKFVIDLRDRFSDRKDSGIPWSPSLKQYNHLHGLVS
jgi:hypothetical protein